MNSFIEQATALLVILWHGGLTVLEKYWPLFLIMASTYIIYSALQ